MKEPNPMPTKTEGSSTSRILTLVFTDLADSTALKAQRGDQAVGELIARHRVLVQRLATESGARIIDWAGVRACGPVPRGACRSAEGAAVVGLPGSRVGPWACSGRLQRPGGSDESAEPSA